MRRFPVQSTLGILAKPIQRVVSKQCEPVSVYQHNNWLTPQEDRTTRHEQRWG